MLTLFLLTLGLLLVASLGFGSSLWGNLDFTVGDVTWNISKLGGKQITFLVGILAFPVLCWLLVLWNAKRLMDCIAKGEAFSLKTSKITKLVGVLMITAEVLSFVAYPILVIALTFSTQEGEIGSFGLSLAFNQIATVLAGMCVIVVGKVLEDAVHIAQENKEFV